MTTFAGRWITSFGPMELQQDGSAVHGAYRYQGVPGRIEGEMRGERFVFRYEDPTGAGEGWFELVTPNQFRGEYRLDGSDHWGGWLGDREGNGLWQGLWDTSFGRLRLVQEEGRVSGAYSGASSGRIEGRPDGRRLVFRYFEPKVQGEGWFELAENRPIFHGAWRPDGAPAWGTWDGQRVFPRPGLTWLVVIEAHWQHSLADAEYSYGDMLKAFFARLPQVAVRQRIFNDEASMLHWCSELSYVAEPAIVLISSHGTHEGVGVQGQTIDPKLIVDSLRDGSNIQLLHFGACLVLKEENAGDFTRRIGKPAPFPISGYTTSVNWGGSAVLEFSYFDMILAKGMSPEQAAALLPTLIAYSGDVAPDSPYGAAGFRFVAASSAEPM
jgi:hypothetical protein